MSCSGLYNCTAIGYNDALGGGGALSDTTTSCWARGTPRNGYPTLSTGKLTASVVSIAADSPAVGFLGAFSPPEVFGYDIETSGVWAPAGEPPDDELGEFGGRDVHGVGTARLSVTPVPSMKFSHSPLPHLRLRRQTAYGVTITVVNGSLGGSGIFSKCQLRLAPRIAVRRGDRRQWSAASLRR